MRVVEVSLSTSGTVIIPLDYHRTPFNVGIGIVPVSGTPAPTIQHTFQDFVNSAVSAPVHWWNHSTLVSVLTTADGNYGFPVRAIRVNQAAAGDCRIYVIQAGLIN